MARVANVGSVVGIVCVFSEIGLANEKGDAWVDEENEKAGGT